MPAKPSFPAEPAPGPPPADRPRGEPGAGHGSADAASGLAPYAYAVLRVVPRVERGEYLNIGVVLFCRPRRFLAVRAHADPARLLALAPDLDTDALRRRLGLLVGVAAGDPAAGALAALPQPERFGWLVSPASTVLQPGPVHPGLTPDPAATLAHLFATLVTLPAPTADRDSRPTRPRRP